MAIFKIFKLLSPFKFYPTSGFTDKWSVEGEAKQLQYKEEMSDLKRRLTNIESWHLNLVKPGMTTGCTLTGRDSKTALMNAGKLAHLIRADDDTKESLLQILDGLGAIIRVLNCSEKINVDKYEKHCRLLGEDILTLGGATSGIGTKKCSWIRINKTLHLVLAHTWQMVKENGGHGLGRLSEEVLEAMQPFLRLLRKTHAWQGDFLENLEQTWDSGSLMGNLHWRDIYENKYGIPDKKKTKSNKSNYPSSPAVETIFQGLLA